MDVAGTPDAPLLDSGSGSGSFSTNNSNTSMFPCDLPPYFPPSLNIHPAISYVQVAIALIMGFTGFFLSLFVLFMIIKYKRLHQRMMYLAAQVVAVDLLYTFTIPPVIFTSGVAGTWLLGTAACNILGMIHDGFVMFRFLMTLILTLDRFVSVFWPFFHLKQSTFPLCVLISMVYFISIARVIIPLQGMLDCYLYVHTLKTCTVFSGCSDSCFWLVVTHSIIVLLFGMLLPLLLNAILFCKSNQVSRSMRNQILPSSTSSAQQPKAADIELKSIDQGREGKDSDLSLSSTVSIQTKPQPPSIANTRLPSNTFEETSASKSRNRNIRANMTMFILLMSVIGSTTPAFTLYFIQFSILRTSPVLYIVNMLVGRTFFYLIPVIDSIAIMRDRDFKTTIRELVMSIQKTCLTRERS